MFLLVLLVLSLLNNTFHYVRGWSKSGYPEKQKRAGAQRGGERAFFCSSCIGGRLAGPGAPPTVHLTSQQGSLALSSDTSFFGTFRGACEKNKGKKSAFGIRQAHLGWPSLSCNRNDDAKNKHNVRVHRQSMRAMVNLEGDEEIRDRRRGGEGEREREREKAQHSSTKTQHADGPWGREGYGKRTLNNPAVTGSQDRSAAVRATAQRTSSRAKVENMQR